LEYHAHHHKACQKMKIKVGLISYHVPVEETLYGQGKQFCEDGLNI
jgi:hypothetical protein